MDLHIKKVWLPGAASCLLFFGFYWVLIWLPFDKNRFREHRGVVTQLRNTNVLHRLKQAALMIQREPYLILGLRQSACPSDQRTSGSIDNAQAGAIKVAASKDQARTASFISDARSSKSPTARP